MLSKIAQKTLSVVFTLGLATMAKADTAVFPFTYTVQTANQITATGSFTTDGYGSLGFNDITTWTITFTSTSLPNESFTLTSLNSQLSFGQDTTINATQSPQNLIIDALDPNGGFTIAGTMTDATGMWNVEWDYANGGAQSLMSIDLVGISNTAGFNNLTFPSSFQTSQLSDVQPIPEPSSLLLLGTGSLAFVATGLRKLRSRSTQA